MNELSRTQTPPGGWQFLQPQTGWSLPTPIASTFDQSVVLIIKHRQANQAITMKHGLATDPLTVGNELENFTRARLGMPQLGSTIPKQMAPPAIPQLSGAVKQAVAAIRKLAAGAALILEWEQGGLPPEPAEVSGERARICSGCPKNQKGKNLSDIFTVPVANMVRRHFERLEQMNLKTPYDDQLGICQACECVMRLKVHAPGSLILAKLKPNQRAELNQQNPRCWVLDLA